MAYTLEQVQQMRDAKIRGALGALAPIWLVKEEFRPREDALIFHLVYNDQSYGWMNRAYKYDAFNNVLYHMGWHLISEDDAVAIQDLPPHIDGEIASHVPNAPAFRAGSMAGRPR